MTTDFGSLIVAEMPRLRRYARALTKDVARADDLLQDALARAVHKQHLWKPGTDMRAWLFTILHNAHVNQVRQAVREGVGLPVDGMAMVLTARDRADSSIAIEELELALSLLPTEQREVLILIGMEELSYEQAAEVLGVPVGTVRSRLSRGRDLLRLLLDGTCAREPGHTTATLRSVAKKVAAAKRRAKYI